MLTRKICHNGRRYIPTCIYMSKRNIQNIDDIDVYEAKTKLSVPSAKLTKREPFVKNLFLGKFDFELMAFPEPQSVDRYNQFFEWIKPIENYMSSVNRNELSKKEAFQALKDLDVLRARINSKYGGLDMSDAETVKVLEILVSVPWLATCFIKNNLMPIDLISKFGNEWQKEYYLPKIGNGELLPTVCITEILTGPNMKNIETEASLSKCDKYWTINGRKEFVTNGIDSNLFLIVARSEEKNLPMHQSLSAFLVESKHGGITCSNAINTMNQREIHLCTVDFKDTCIPKENLLSELCDGNNVLLDVYAPGTNRIAGESIGILRNFLSLMNKNILGRKHLDKNMHEFEAIQEIVGHISSRLYCMESVALFTSSLNDIYDGQDLEIEKAITENYCSNECVKQIQKGLQVIGVESYMENNPYMQLYQDALGLSLFDGSSIDEKIFIALLGLQYVGKDIHEDIKKSRNILQNPLYMFKQFMSHKKVNLNLFEYAHLSLKVACTAIEEAIEILVNTSALLLDVYGSEISSKHIVLQKFADIVIQLYVAITVVSRASRSYCTGMRNNDQERYIAVYVARQMHKSIQLLKDDIQECCVLYSDRALDTVSKSAFENKGYMCEHPLIRNV
ncbi:PREDICTED: acyl-CoA dehydrogenase family member 9, mitochondrial [Polistes dominula]|uniref:Acyl-CoA dehydrogenase family member 9, mitochondrial n=1 Tax=Polistes dominula TaxID=743375 RepID=A0ABM1IAY7_POLDO|nr:PREDICTED: acyl-CoA dehydrogenase family member 9, mitochondrial [Polistes dominula]